MDTPRCLVFFLVLIWLIEGNYTRRSGFTRMISTPYRFLCVTLHSGSVYHLYEEPTCESFLRINRLTPLRVGSSAHNTVSVAASSRLRSHRTLSQPLSGIRVIVKDIFDIEGIRTSLGSRDHLRLYPPASQTALAIQLLVDSGCQVLSLSKMCSTVLKQEPTQSIEFLAPFNPRADGWQSPSGGSSGQACAIAQYDWLDIAIASDCECIPTRTW